MLGEDLLLVSAPLKREKEAGDGSKHESSSPPIQRGEAEEDRWPGRRERAESPAAELCLGVEGYLLTHGRGRLRTELWGG
jgi:hypothetical protein